MVVFLFQIKSVISNVMVICGINYILNLLNFSFMNVSKATEFNVNILSWVHNRYSSYTHFMEYFILQVSKS